MANYRNETVTFDAELMEETERAWLFNIDGDELWVPKSLGEWHEAKNKVDGEIEVPTWWAERNNLA